MLLLGLALVGSWTYAWIQYRSIGQLTSARDQLAASLSQTKAEIDNMSTQLKAMAAAQRSAEQVPAESAASVAARRSTKQQPVAARRDAAQHARAPSTPVDDPRWKKVESDLAKTRSDLEGSIKSSHDELNDAIARTHEELMVLQRKGERNYYEFDISKSKQFERVGPISVSLRKASTKHSYCDLEVRLDDNQMSKKHVNLYEPVLFYQEGYSLPIEVVVNRIDKNRIKGYASKPKFAVSQAASPDINRTEPVSSSGTNPAKMQE
jgi:hypothetical protein